MSASDSPPHPLEACLQRTFAKVENYVRQEPAKAVGTALAAGLLLKALPPRAVARPLTAACAALLPSVFVGLGFIKALELCMCQEQQPPSPAPAPSAPATRL